VAFRTESGVAARRPEVLGYLEQDRWYGRGTADNKGQHTINLAALEQVLRARGGRLGFNLTILIETAGLSLSRIARECAFDAMSRATGQRPAAPL